jgi:hypothetical protein
MHTKKTYISILTITMILLACVCYGKGPDDGMSIAGESLYDRDNVDLDKNISYTIIKAKAHTNQKNNPNTGSGDHGASIGSVYVEAGAKVGDIFLNNEIKGDSTAMSFSK